MEIVELTQVFKTAVDYGFAGGIAIALLWIMSKIALRVINAYIDGNKELIAGKTNLADKMHVLSEGITVGLTKVSDSTNMIYFKVESIHKDITTMLAKVDDLSDGQNHLKEYLLKIDAKLQEILSNK